jgi:predicted RNA-binding protein YlxR (DUF448 family)
MTATTRSPARTCIGCRTKRPQVAMLRVAVLPDGNVVVDRTAPGRGAWLCDPPNACFESARKRRGFEKAFRRPVGVVALDELAAGLGIAQAFECLRKG